MTTRAFALLAAAACALPAWGAEPAADPSAQPRPAPLVEGSPGSDTPAVVLRKPNAIFPGAVDREALVYLRLTISTEGRVTNIELLDQGFHEPRFVAAAEKLARGSVFRPSLRNGKPVESVAVLPIHFTVNDEGGRIRGVTREFREELVKVGDFIESGDNAGAHFHAQWMLREKVKLGFEYAVLNGQLADTHARNGNVHRAIESARLATARTTSAFPRLRPGEPIPANRIENYLLPREWITALLTMRLRLCAENGLTSDALDAWYELASLTKPAATDPAAQVGAAMERALMSGQQLVGKIQIGERGYWQHFLSRRSFTLSEVKGTVVSIDLSCGPNRREMKYVPDVDWHIPATWNDCLMNIKGAPDTSFAVLEHALESPTASPAPQ